MKANCTMRLVSCGRERQKREGDLRGRIEKPFIFLLSCNKGGILSDAGVRFFSYLGAKEGYV